MVQKKNPLKLNALQLKTLTVLQQLATVPMFASADEASGEVLIRYLPSPHGDHFHCGDAVVMSKDATGLQNKRRLDGVGAQGAGAIDVSDLYRFVAHGAAL